MSTDAFKDALLVVLRNVWCLVDQ